MVYPAGDSPALWPPAASYQWTSWSYPVNANLSSAVNEGYQIPPSSTFPGNWAGNGNINELIPGGATLGDASYLFSVMSPSTGVNGARLTGSVSAAINFWQPTAVRTAAREARESVTSSTPRTSTASQTSTATDFKTQSPTRLSA